MRKNKNTCTTPSSELTASAVRPPMPSEQQSQATGGCFTVPQFCKNHGISRAHLYGLWARGQGPARTRGIGRTLIPFEAAATWRMQHSA